MGSESDEGGQQRTTLKEAKAMVNSKGCGRSEAEGGRKCGVDAGKGRDDDVS